MEEKRQLSAIHQQRVQFELNNKKRDAMEKYMDVSCNLNSIQLRKIQFNVVHSDSYVTLSHWGV